MEPAPESAGDQSRAVVRIGVDGNPQWSRRPKAPVTLVA